MRKEPIDSSNLINRRWDGKIGATRVAPIILSFIHPCSSLRLDFRFNE